ncbi:MAG: hypothetical protein RSB82_02065 [Victivallaceae bacterium]
MATPIGPSGVPASNPEKSIQQPKKGILKNPGGKSHEVTTGGGSMGEKVVSFADQRFHPERTTPPLEKKALMPPTGGRSSPGRLQPSRPAPLPPTGGRSSPGRLQPSRPAPLPPARGTSSQGASGSETVKTSDTKQHSTYWEERAKNTKGGLGKCKVLAAKIFKKDQGTPEYLKYQTATGKARTVLKDAFSDFKSSISNGLQVLKKNISNAADKLKTDKKYPVTVNRDLQELNQGIDGLLQNVETGRPDPRSKAEQEKLEALLINLNAAWALKTGRMPE